MGVRYQTPKNICRKLRLCKAVVNLGHFDRAHGMVTATKWVDYFWWPAFYRVHRAALPSLCSHIKFKKGSRLFGFFQGLLLRVSFLCAVSPTAVENRKDLEVANLVAKLVHTSRNENHSFTRRDCVLFSAYFRSVSLDLLCYC